MADPGMWRERWEAKNTPWNLGGNHPLIGELVEFAQEWGGLAPEGRLWVPGCGHGFDAAYLATRKYAVTATDLIDLAIATAKEMNPTSTVDWRVDNVLQSDLPDGSFDGIYDRAMMLALPLPLRKQFVEQAFRKLKPGGVFMSIAFSKVSIPEEAGPPFAMSPPQLMELMKPYARFVFGEEREDGAVGHTIEREMLGIWVKH